MAERLDLNRASVEELETIPGLTRAVARRIVAERERTGLFRSVGTLREVAGVSAEVLAALRDGVMVDPVLGQAEPKTVLVLLDPQSQHAGRYGGYKVSAEFGVKLPVAGTEETVATAGSTSADPTPDGVATLHLPDPVQLEGTITFVVRAPDGEVVARHEEKPDSLADKIAVPVTPRALPTPQPSDDPAFQQPAKLRGRVIDREGRVQIAAKQVVIWTAQTANPQDGDFAAVMVATTDATGYFSGRYPLGTFTAAHATVALDPTQAVAVHLDEEGALPADVILVVDAPRKATDPHDDCSCKSPDGATPRNPDAADLVNGTFTTDIGQGKCVDFTRPDRTLQEFAYSYVVRTTEPSIKGMTLSEPKRIPPGLFNEIVKLSQLTALTARRVRRGRRAECTGAAARRRNRPR
jgi:hypothetical protein